MLPALSIAAVLAAGGDNAIAKPAKPQERQSLEQFLAHAREQQQAVQQRLLGEVEKLVSELEASDGSPSKLNERDAALVALGTDATPLLVRYLDAGEDAVDKEKLRASHVAAALARMDTSAVTDQLLRMVEHGAPQGRRNALRVLEHTKDAARVRPAVESLFMSSQGTLRQACLRTLVALGGDVRSMLSEVFKGADENLTAMALVTMTETRNADAAELVRSVLFDSQRASTHALALLDYYRALPELAGEQEVMAFAKLGSGTASMDTRVAVIEALPVFKPRLSSELKRALEPVVTSSDRRLSEAGLVALCNMGDKLARKKLIEPYDERVKQNDSWSQAWVDRGDVYYRIADWDAAIKDYSKAIELGNDDRALKPDVYVKIARCYMHKNKLKEASTYLKRAPISRQQLRALADDPEFRPLRDSNYGKETFGLE